MNIKNLFTKKRIIWGIILLVIAGITLRVFVFKKSNTSNILTDTVKRQDLKQTVLATGQVTSSTDLNLAFKASGIVQRINAKVGDKVSSGSVLASLDGRDQLASLTSARGSLAQAQANYDKVIAGASGADVDIAKATVASAQTTLDSANSSYKATVKQHDILVTNAKSAFLNASLTAVPANGDSSFATVTVSGVYNSEEQGVYNIKLYYSGLGVQYGVSGLESSNVVVSRGIPLPLGNRGLYITFSNSGTLSDGAQWKIAIPNTQGSTYVTYYNAYLAAVQARDQAVLAAQNAVNAALASLDQAKAALAQKQAVARPEDLAVARAQILSAQGQVQAASASLENTIIRAPSNGTITAIDVKVGEQAQSSKEAIVLQDVDNLHIEANVSEANIAQVAVGQTVSYTFDALGPDRTFAGTVQLVDPASTVVSGVVNYKITTSVDKVPEIKPGMTGNMTVLTASKQAVLTVPTRAVLNHDNKKFVRVIDDLKKKTYHEVEVTTGLDADGGLIEITSGLSEGQSIVTFINTK